MASSFITVPPSDSSTVTTPLRFLRHLDEPAMFFNSSCRCRRLGAAAFHRLVQRLEHPSRRLPSGLLAAWRWKASSSGQRRGRRAPGQRRKHHRQRAHPEDPIRTNPVRIAPAAEPRCSPAQVTRCGPSTFAETPRSARNGRKSAPFFADEIRQQQRHPDHAFTEKAHMTQDRQHRQGAQIGEDQGAEHLRCGGRRWHILEAEPAAFARTAREANQERP